jgi:two-component system response regulator ResD
LKPTENSSKIKVLVVDDEKDICDLIVQRLENSGFQADQALSGKEALTKIEHSCPDVVLLDFMMPEMDGREVCKILRRESRYDALSIIFLTARGEDWDYLEGYAGGGDSYLVKPVRVGMLLEEIQKVLKQKRKS